MFDPECSSSQTSASCFIWKLTQPFVGIPEGTCTHPSVLTVGTAKALVPGPNHYPLASLNGLFSEHYDHRNWRWSRVCTEWQRETWYNTSSRWEMRKFSILGVVDVEFYFCRKGSGGSCTTKWVGRNDIIRFWFLAHLRLCVVFVWILTGAWTWNKSNCTNYVR